MRPDAQDAIFFFLMPKVMEAPGRMKDSMEIWPLPEEDMRWVATVLVMSGYAGSAILDGGRSKVRNETQPNRLPRG